MFWKPYLVALASIATVSSGKHWKQILYDHNFPSSDAPSMGGGNSGYHIQNDPKPYAVVKEKAQYFKDLGSERKTIKYGKFMVPPMSKNNGMIDYLQLRTPMPCTDCTITYVHAGLEYPDGRYANANTSLWLHHIIFIDASEPDTVCGSDYYGAGQRWFASGNERTPIDFCNAGKIPTGYYVAPDSYNVMLVELMNNMMMEQEAVATVTFEYVPGKLRKGWWKTRPIWLDIAGCHIKSDMPAKTNTTFTYEMSPPYKSEYTGAVLGMGGHVHDGGINLEIHSNNQMRCDSFAKYGGNPGYWSPKNMMMCSAKDMKGPGLHWHGGNAKTNREHISSISTCYAPTGMIEKGDILKNKVWYNFNKHSPMLNTDCTIMDIMGISLVYMAPGMTMKDIDGYVNGHH